MNNFTIGTSATIVSILLLTAPSEPVVDDMYPTTRYERCMVLYGDTVDDNLCDKERADALEGN